jgi:hypothetical protein
MFAKAWRWLTARVNGKQQRPLRLVVHRDARYPSFWQPTELPDQQPHTEIKIYLEASNLSARAYWITAAELAGIPALQTVVGVRDARTRAFAPDNPLPPQRITTVSLDFHVDGQPPSIGEPFRVTVILTDHLGGRHFVKVIMH